MIGKTALNWSLNFIVATRSLAAAMASGGADCGTAGAAQNRMTATRPAIVNERFSMRSSSWTYGAGFQQLRILHSSFRFWSRFLPAQGPAQQPLEPGDELLRAERPSRGFRRPQARDDGGVGLLRDQIGKAPHAVDAGGDANEPVVALGKVRMHARPWPVLRPCDKTGTHRVERDIAHRRQQVVLVHDH